MIYMSAAFKIINFKSLIWDIQLYTGFKAILTDKLFQSLLLDSVATVFEIN